MDQITHHLNHLFAITHRQTVRQHRKEGLQIYIYIYIYIYTISYEYLVIKKYKKIQKKIQGPPGVEPGTCRSLPRDNYIAEIHLDCLLQSAALTTELRPHCTFFIDRKVCGQNWKKNKYECARS